MALTKSLTINNNFGTPTTFPNAYIQVSQASTDGTTVWAQISIKNQQGGINIESANITFPYSPNIDILVQAYSYLLTLSTYSGATSVA